MKRFLATAAVVSLLSTGAFAFGNTSNSNNNNGNTTNAPTANGGAGGSAYQGQIGVNKSKNDNYNKIDDSGNSKSKSVVKDSGNSFSASGALSGSSSKQKQDASSENSIAIGGDSYIAAEIPANTAYAPVVIATSDCLGSLSAGGQGSGIGLSFGGTTQSKPCNVREFAKMNAANEVLFYAIQCQDPIVKEAFKVTGMYKKYCVGAKAKTHSKWFGLVNKRAYEEVCAYPTAECKRYKKLN